MVKHIHVPIPNQRSEFATSHVIEEGAVRTALTLWRRRHHLSEFVSCRFEISSQPLTFARQFAEALGEVAQILVYFRLDGRSLARGRSGKHVSARGADAVMLAPATTTDRKKLRRLVASGKVALGIWGFPLGLSLQ